MCNSIIFCKATHDWAIAQSRCTVSNVRWVVGLHRPWLLESMVVRARCNVGRWNNGTTRELQTCVTPVNRPQGPDTLYKKVACIFFVI